MSASKAQKQRKKLEREGRANPEQYRREWLLQPVERMTPTLEERKRKHEKKHKQKWNQIHDSGLIPFFVFIGEITISDGNEADPLHSSSTLSEPASRW